MCRPPRLPGSGWRRPLLAAAALGAATACGGGGAPGDGPSKLPPQITAIRPEAGVTGGDTAVTITGAQFRAGATVTIAGVPATAVVVTSPDAITARTGAHPAGTGDVVVTEDGMSAKLPDGFTYAIPGPSNNAPPQITSVVAKGTRKNEPERFADLAETLRLTATVIDTETPGDALAYKWTATAGTFSGTGASVSWTAPSEAATPADVSVTLTVSERFITDDTATPTLVENTATQTVTVSLHDSVKEVGSMATLFLVNFSQSSVPVDVVMQDFLPGCYGTSAEREQVADNRRTFVITAWTVSPSPGVTLNFGGACNYDAHPGDACSYSDVEWHSTNVETKKVGATAGVDQVAAMYRASRWWLCDSRFIGHSLSAQSNGFLELLSR